MKYLYVVECETCMIEVDSTPSPRIAGMKVTHHIEDKHRNQPACIEVHTKEDQQ